MISLIWDIVTSIFKAKKEEKKEIKNIYRFQLDNKRSPYSTCFPTCVSMLLSNYSVSYSPDSITSMCNDGEYLSWIKKNIWKWDRFKNCYQVLWRLEEKILVDILKQSNIDRKVFYNTLTTRGCIISQVDSGNPVIVNTSPKYKGKTLGHIVLVVGYDKVNHNYIIDDPFGCIADNYKTQTRTSGDNVIMSAEDFDAIRGKLSLSLC